MQTVNLQMAPTGVPPVIHVSQFDVGRQFQLVLYDGAAAYSLPSGATAQIDGIKPDKKGFSYSDAVSVSGNTLTITTKLQMTIVLGEVECEIRLKKNDLDLGTLNFRMIVEASPINGNTDISETDLPDIIALATEQMENAEAWAKGTKNGVDVESTEPQYHNNSKYWSDESATSAAASDASAEDSEAWAVGTRDGTAVGSDDDTYHNNSKYYADNCADIVAEAVSEATTICSDYAAISKAWAVGPSGAGESGTDTNNSKYWSNQSKGYAETVAEYMNTMNAYIALMHLLFGAIYLNTEDGDRLITESGDNLIMDF